MHQGFLASSAGVSVSSGGLTGFALFSRSAFTSSSLALALVGYANSGAEFLVFVKRTVMRKRTEGPS